MKPTDPRNPTGYRFAMAHVDHQGDGCLIWPFACCTPGYGIFSYEKKRHLAHRFICEQKHGPAPDPDYHAAHSCGNRRCINPSHLRWKSQSDNQRERREHGTHNKTRRKITQMQADQIRELKGMETSIETAARYGITESNVRQIQEGKTWVKTGKMQIWTPEDDAKLKAALDSGLRLQDVAVSIGRDYGSVTGRMYRLGLGAKSGHHACRRTS